MKRDAPHWIEVALVAAILLALFVVLGGCTYTRGPCTVTKQVHYVFACELEGRVIHVQPFAP